MEKILSPVSEGADRYAADTAAESDQFTDAMPRIDAAVERLERITVCTRPFRGRGPRIEAERVGDRLLIHNYGHGGSGWSLSWGSAELVLPLALSDGVRAIAVVGCGAIGLTTALTLQRAGADVTIYAREMPPEVRSSRATGLWSPDSRLALAREAGEEFPSRWEGMARASWAEFGRLLELPGRPVVMHTRYVLSELPPEEEIAQRYREDPVGFAHYDERLSDLYRAPRDFGMGEHPFRTRYCRSLDTLRFDVTALSGHLLAEFRERGGVVQRTELHTAAELLQLPQAVVVNCTGWGARALFDDASLKPVRGQIGWLPPQPEVNYSLQWGKLSMVSRADGVVVQFGASSDGTGWNEGDEQPDRAESERAVRLLSELYGR